MFLTYFKKFKENRLPFFGFKKFGPKIMLQNYPTLSTEKFAEFRKSRWNGGKNKKS
jgi:hypothetical protein